MKRYLKITATVIISILLLIIALRTNQIEGCYDTSIVGSICQYAYIHIKNTNVLLISSEGDNDTNASIGTIVYSNNKAVWLCNQGSKWYLEPHLFSLKCIDYYDAKNVFVLKWRPLNKYLLKRELAQEDKNIEFK